MQQLPRHILWLALNRNPPAAKSFLADARLGFPNELAAPLSGPVVAPMCRLNGATDAAARAELPCVAAALRHVDSLIADRRSAPGAQRRGLSARGAGSNADVPR